MILFATHGNGSIGMGHVVRCLALAQELRERADVPILFRLPPEDTVAKQQVWAAGYSQNDPAPGTVACAISDYADGGYFSTPGAMSVCLADVASEAHAGADATFATFGTIDTERTWAGPQYAILRQQFVQARVRKRTHEGPALILMSFGGADPCNLLDPVTHALADTPYRLAAVLGPAYKHAPPYIHTWGGRVEMHNGPVAHSNSMAALMAQADLLICSGGMTPIEAACMGLPTVILAQNAREHARMLDWQHAWTGVYLGQAPHVKGSTVRKEATHLLTDPNTLPAMSLRGKALVDGLGAQRVAGLVLDLARMRQQARSTGGAPLPREGGGGVGRGSAYPLFTLDPPNLVELGMGSQK